jgi:23S rRNA (cytidine2498-2'-O)-methyltransferase
MKQITGYLAPRGFEGELLDELKGSMQVEEIHERLILASGPPLEATWAQNIWRNPQKIEFQSISQAAQALRAMQRNWALYSLQSHRRAQLIRENLPKVSAKILEGPTLLPSSPMGSWTLVSDTLMLAASSCSSPLPHGEIHFAENRTEPPSRAYLKLWEALSLAGSLPKAGDRCLDMGSSPGGWTWALQRLGVDVISVDRSELAPTVASLPRVEFIQGDAFALDPSSLGQIDWFFSDVICYPQKLLKMVEKWMQTGSCPRFICTIKFQGKELSVEDREAVRDFLAIPGSRVQHLFHNKHELTWIKV